MLNKIQSPQRKLSSTFTDDDFIATMGNAPLIKVGNTWRVEKLPNIIPVQVFAALGNGASGTIYTVTAGNLPVVYTLEISTSVAGQLSVLYNGVGWKSFYLAVNSTMVVTMPKGCVFPTTGGAFTVVNQTGAAANISGSMTLSEYTP